MDRLESRLPVEDREPREERVSDGAERVEIRRGASTARPSAISGAMNAGVPAKKPVCVMSARRGRERLHEAEVEHLHEIGIAAVAADEDVAGLDVAVDEARRVRLGERVADLPEEVHDAPRRKRPEAADDRPRA